MAVIASGRLEDRYPGWILFALAQRQFSGDVIIGFDNKTMGISFASGAVVAAVSPSLADSAARTAMAIGLINTSQAAQLAKSAELGIDAEVDMVLATARAPEQRPRLMRRVIAQRAVRVFALNQGTFEVRDEYVIDRPQPRADAEPVQIDARALVYMGAKNHLTVDGVTALLGANQWHMSDEALPWLTQYGFTEADRPILAALRNGVGLEGLTALYEAGHTDAFAVAFALFATDMLSIAAAQAAAAHIPAPMPAAMPAPSVARAGGPSIAAPLRRTTVEPLPTHAPTLGATSGTPGTSGTSGTPGPANTMAKAAPPPSPSNTTDPAAQAKARELILQKLQLFRSKADHFALLGVAPDATAEQIQASYLLLARTLHPDKLKAVGIADEKRDAQAMFARINEAFATLKDASKRAQYKAMLAAGGEAAVKAQQAQAEAQASRLLEAEQAFQLGEQALRQGRFDAALLAFKTAVELNADEGEHHAYLAWATFGAAAEKAAAFTQVTRHLTTARRLSPKSVAPDFLAGKMLRILGRDREAAAMFEAVVKAEPGHADAAAELRAINMRGHSSTSTAGLFSRKR